MGGSSASSYLANPSLPIPSHYASIVVTSTLRVNNPEAQRVDGRGMWVRNEHYDEWSFRVCLRHPRASNTSSASNNNMDRPASK